jgi:hypothetical protein
MKTYGGVEVELHEFLTLALDGDVVSFRLRALHPRENDPRNPLDGGSACPRAGVDAVAKRKNVSIAPAGNRKPVTKPVIYSLCWWSYPGSIGSM